MIIHDDWGPPGGCALMDYIGLGQLVSSSTASGRRNPEGMVSPCYNLAFGTSLFLTRFTSFVLTPRFLPSSSTLRIISFLLFPCVSVWANDRERVPCAL